MKKIDIHYSYKLVKEALFGHFYYQCEKIIIGRVENGTPEEGFLYATLSYLNDFFKSFNPHNFTGFTAREIFDFANAQELGEEGDPRITAQLKMAGSPHLENNLKVIPPTDLFDDYEGGVFRINDSYFFYCTYQNEILLNTQIDFIAFRNDFMLLKSAIGKIKPDLLV